LNCCNEKIIYVGKDFFKKVPFVGIICIKDGFILINRANLEQSIKQLDEGVENAKREGKSICSAPEGTRRRSKSVDDASHLLPFKKGPFHMAKKANLDLVPVTYSGIKRLTGGWVARPGTIVMRIGPRIARDKCTNLTIEQTMEVAYSQMKSMMTPVSDDVIYNTTKTRKSWLIFFGYQLVMYFTAKWFLCLFCCGKSHASH